MLHTLNVVGQNKTIEGMAKELETLRNKHDYPYRDATWKSRYDQSHCRILVENDRWLRKKT